jgi:hypothetical protein
MFAPRSQGVTVHFPSFFSAERNIIQGCFVEIVRSHLIGLHEKSTYRDLQFIAQQIMDFSYLSWRSYFPNETPVTTFYSELMARLSGKLQRVHGWNPTVLDRYFRRKTWFL